MNGQTQHHIPVLLEEVLELARGKKRIVDATLGDGGHTRAFLEAGSVVFAIDRDPEAIGRTQARLGMNGIEYHLGRFGDSETISEAMKFEPDFVLLDLGVSSLHLDDESRGFSFREGAPLDMRMNPDRQTRTGADLLNESDEKELVRLFSDYADEPRARRLAREVVKRRSNRPFLTSDDLVGAVRAVLGPRSGPKEFARIFQAVRIAVNEEFDQLERALSGYRNALIEGGVLSVITYHSGEDRIVKQTFRSWAKTCICPPEFPVCACRGKPLGKLLTRKPVLPTEAETTINPRARSAKIRAFQVQSST